MAPADFGFAARHIGPDAAERGSMLARLGYDDLAAFTADVVPEVIRWHDLLDLPAPASEPETIAELTSMAARNRVQGGRGPRESKYAKLPICNGF